MKGLVISTTLTLILIGAPCAFAEEHIPPPYINPATSNTTAQAQANGTTEPKNFPSFAAVVGVQTVVSLILAGIIR